MSFLPLPDDALVVRGGLVSQDRHLKKKCRSHPDGVFGLSVQSAPGKSVAELVEAAPNLHGYGQVGVTTVGKIRVAGYDVIRTSGIGSHATLQVPSHWSDEEAAELASLFIEIPNPIRLKAGN